MTLLFMEGFGSWATGNMDAGSGKDYLGNWLSLGQGGYVAAVSSGSQGTKKSFQGRSPYYYMPLKSRTWSGVSTIYVGFRAYHNGSGRYLSFYDSSTKMGSIGINAGHASYTNSGAGTLSDTVISDQEVIENSWTYIEAKIVFHSSAGTVDFWIDGTASGSYTSLNTLEAGASCTSIVLGVNDTNHDWYPGNKITDIYVDTATQHGPMDIWYQAADTAGSASNFTPSAGNNEDNVDEVAGNDGDTTYNTSTLVTTKDQVAHSDTLNVAPLAIQPMAFARYIPAGAANLQVGILSGGTEDLASLAGLSDTYKGIVGTIYEVDPNTSSAWTASNADAAETVYKHA
jgi:hypothetical protein